MLTGTGIWSASLRYGDPGEIADAVGELDALGYSAAWIPDFGDDVYGALELLLGATSDLVAATGVMNIWLQTPEATNGWWQGLSSAHRDRTLLGLGVSHAPLIGEQWGKPLGTMRAFLDTLEVPEEHLCLAALGPKMQLLARDRTSGVHPYLVTPDLVASTRANVGPDKLIAVAQPVMFESDATTARNAAREELQTHAGLPNYTNNWRRAGFTDDDVSELSDHLIDALVAWGDVDTIARRVAEQRDAGADHVCLQVMPGFGLQRDAWRTLAGI